MRIVIAPDSFKGTLSAAAAAAAMAQGVRRVVPAADVAVFPMADGGEGTLEVLLAAQGGVRYEVDTWDPLGRPVRAAFGWLASGAGRTAVVELAAASGLVFLAEAERTPSAALAASTYGTGELIRAALDAGADEVVLTLGGSATTDGGFGLLTALGATARAAGGRPLSGRDARELGLVEHVDLAGLHPRFHHVVFRLASDVTHPLCGPDGAARVFGPQKGMDEAAIVRRDEELARWAERLSAAARTAGLGRAAEDVRAVPGLGAAGGAGLPLYLLAGAEFVAGARWLAEVTGLASAVHGADLVLTGEGRTDGQSRAGKVPAWVATLARAAGAPCWVISGALGPGHETLAELGVQRFVAATPAGASREDMARHAALWLADATAAALQDVLQGAG